VVGVGFGVVGVGVGLGFVFTGLAAGSATRGALDVIVAPVAAVTPVVPEPVAAFSPVVTALTSRVPSLRSTAAAA
jgi:hypothetical protein